MAHRLQHALERLQERYDSSATMNEVVDAEEALREGSAVRIRSTAAGAVYLVRIRRGLAALAVFHEQQRSLITFLPADDLHRKAEMQREIYSDLPVPPFPFQRSRGRRSRPRKQRMWR